MHYEGDPIRPPSEADSILLQVTVGCSHQACTFCGAYQGVRFHAKTDAIIDADLACAARHFTDRQRLFLCDGDAVALPHSRLLDLLGRIRSRLPWVSRVSAYASARSLRGRSVEELAALKAAGLKMLYLGLESGDDTVLSAVNKGVTADEQVDAGRRIRAAGIRLSVTVLLGLAGDDVEASRRHAAATGAALSRMQPEHIAALTLMLVPGTPLHAAARRGAFRLPDAASMLRELRDLVAAIEVPRAVFSANHASNFLPIQARLPSQRAEVLALIDAARAGMVGLRPEALRGL